MLAAQNSQLLTAGSKADLLAKVDLLGAILLQEVTNVAHRLQTHHFLKIN
jgi:hypothetical protein